MSDWASARLGTLCVKIGSGATPRGGKETYKENGISLIRSQNVYNNRFEKTGLAFIDDEQAAGLANVEVESGDVLLNITGDSVARACQVPETVLPARVNQHVAIVRPDSCRLDPGFLRYWLVSPRTQAHMLALASAGATRKALTKGMIEDFELPLPRLAAQRRIAHILGTLDDKIELNRRMNRTLEAIARAIFKSWFVDFDPVYAKAEGREPVGMDPETAALFPDSFQDSPLGKIPKGWGVRTLGEVISLEYGKALKASIRQPGSVPVYGSNGRVGWHNEALVPGPGIVVGRKGNPGTVTWVAEAFFPIDTTFYVVPADEPVSLRYLYHALRIQDLPALAADSAVPGLNRNIAYENKLVLPSVQLLGEFECACTALAARVETNVGESRTLAQVRDALLPRLLSGQLLVAAMGEARADD